MPRKIYLLIISLLGFVIIMSCMVLSGHFQKKYALQSSAIQKQANTVLRLIPISQKSGKVGKVNVVIDTHGDQVSGVQLEIGYDPTVLNNVKIQPAGFFPKQLILLSSVDTDDGRISYAAGLSPSLSPVTGSGIVATITYTIQTPDSADQTELTFLPKTRVSASSISTSVLKVAEGTQIPLPE